MSTITVKYPWCGPKFSVPIVAKYKSVEAIVKDQRGGLGVQLGENT